MKQIQSITEPVVVILGVDDSKLDYVVGLAQEMLSTLEVIAQAAREAGARLVAVPTASELVAAADLHFPVLMLVQLPVVGDWAAAIRRCKVRPHSSSIPIYLFSRVLDKAMVQSAQQAGADQIWTTAQMVTEITGLVKRCVNPPIIYLAGWDDPLPALALQGLAEFNRGAYFEQHELLEAAWMAEERPIRQLYQGILQIGVAFLQIEAQNWAGAIKMLRRGLPKLRNLPPVCQGIDLDSLRQTAAEIHAELVRLGADNISEFDQGRFPKISRLQRS